MGLSRTDSATENLELTFEPGGFDEITVPMSGVSGSINPSLQWQHFKADTLVPNSVTSQQRGHLQKKT